MTVGRLPEIIDICDPVDMPRMPSSQFEHAQIESLIISAFPILTRIRVNKNAVIQMVEQSFPESMQVAGRPPFLITKRVVFDHLIRESPRIGRRRPVNIPERIVRHPDSIVRVNLAEKVEQMRIRKPVITVQFNNYCIIQRHLYPVNRVGSSTLPAAVMNVLDPVVRMLLEPADNLLMGPVVRGIIDEDMSHLIPFIFLAIYGIKAFQCKIPGISLTRYDLEILIAMDYFQRIPQTLERSKNLPLEPGKDRMHFTISVRTVY